MKNIILYIFLAVVLVACKKSDGNDLEGDSEMSGTLLIENTYDDSLARKLAGQEVFIFKDENSASYMFSARTNTNGEFLFRFLESENRYRAHAEVRAKTRLDNNILFTADSALNPAGNVSLVLRPDEKKQNGLFLSCVDDRSPAGAIPNASIYIFTSKVLAELDTAAMAGSGANYSFNAALDGTAFKMNLPAGRLYINAVFNTPAAGPLKSKVNEVTLGATGLTPATIVLQR